MFWALASIFYSSFVSSQMAWQPAITDEYCPLGSNYGSSSVMLWSERLQMAYQLFVKWDSLLSEGLKVPALPLPLKFANDSPPLPQPSASLLFSCFVLHSHLLSYVSFLKILFFSIPLHHQHKSLYFGDSEAWGIKPAEKLRFMEAWGSKRWLNSELLRKHGLIHASTWFEMEELK